MKQHPCKKCITRVICRQHRTTQNDADILNRLGKKCPEFFNYLSLKDLGLKPPAVSMAMKDRLYFNTPLAKRVIETMNIFKWTEYYDMTRWEHFAQS